MPLRSDFLTKRWSTVECPILPFLAPRVFTPWPSKSRRAHTVATTVQRPDASADSHNVPPQLSKDKRQELQSSGFLLRRLKGNETISPKQPDQRIDDGTQIPGSAWKDVRIHGTGDSAEISGTSFGFPFDKEFRKKYEEIWGTEQELPHITRTRRRKELADSEPIMTENELVAGGVHTHRTLRERTVHRTRAEYERRNFWLRKQQGDSDHDMEGEGTDHTRWSIGDHLRHVQDLTQRWRKGFAGLHNRQIGGSDHPKVPIGPIDGNREADSTYLKALINSKSSASLREAWEALPPGKRTLLWPELMLSTIKEHPTKALKVLAATDIYPYPPGEAVGDTFNYIISYYLGNRTARSPKNALEIFRLLKRMLQTGPPHHFHIKQSSIYLLVQNLDSAFVGELFRILTKLNHKLHKNTLSHFPSKLRLSGGTDERMEVLKRLWQEGADFNSPEIISVCVTILQLKNRYSEVTYSDSEIFAYMLDCGMMPNIVIYNVLLQNSLEAGDHETGWQIHDMMMENGIETDAYTYSLLLSDAKLRNDQPSIERVINNVSDKGIRSAHIVTDLLHIIFIFRGTYNKARHWDEQKGRPSNTFARMLFIYRQYFHLEPLTHLIPWLENSYPNTQLVSKEMLMDAPVPALTVMLTAFLRQPSEPGPIVRFNNHFCSLVQAGDVVATSLSKSTHIYNIILKALGSFQQTLALCPRLIGEMLLQNVSVNSEHPEDPARASRHERQSLEQANRQPYNDIESQNGLAQDQMMWERSTDFPTTRLLYLSSPDSTSLTLSTSNRSGIYPKPDVYTWSVLLKAFMDHGQPRAAEKVLTMMKHRKVWPNQVTWNSLILGYARMQDMSMTVDAVNRLQRAGFTLDAVSMKGLAYFHNRRALIEAMKASEADNPGRSLSRRPVAIGLARTALNKTLRMVKENGLEMVAETTDGAEEPDFRDDKDVSSIDSTEKGASKEFIVGDIPVAQDEIIGSIQI